MRPIGVAMKRRLTLQIDHHHVPDRRARGELGGQQGEPIRGRYEHSGTAVADDVGRLWRLQDVIDRDEHSSCRRCPKNGCHCFDPLVQIDRNAIVFQQSETDETRGHRLGELPELDVADGDLAIA